MLNNKSIRAVNDISVMNAYIIHHLSIDILLMNIKRQSVYNIILNFSSHIILCVWYIFHLTCDIIIFNNE